MIAGYLAFHFRASAFPEGMDADGDRVVSLGEWLRFHKQTPRFYGGYDKAGPIPKGGAAYYEREFERVDCDYDSKLDAYEFRELRWNMRWCGSRPPRRSWWETLNAVGAWLVTPSPKPPKSIVFRRCSAEEKAADNQVVVEHPSGASTVFMCSHE
jgi:hypothetical protein